VADKWTQTSELLAADGGPECSSLKRTLAANQVPADALRAGRCPSGAHLAPDLDVPVAGEAIASATTATLESDASTDSPAGR
jgi:hypothetical protein